MYKVGDQIEHLTAPSALYFVDCSHGSMFVLSLYSYFDSIKTAQMLIVRLCWIVLTLFKSVCTEYYLMLVSCYYLISAPDNYWIFHEDSKITFRFLSP